MDTPPTQTLPPGWRLEATGPFPGSTKCRLRLTTPDGSSASWEVEEPMPQCEVVRQFAHAMALTGRSYRHDDDLPGPL